MVYNDAVPDNSVMYDFNDVSPKSHFTFKLEHNNKFNPINTTLTNNNNSTQTSVHMKYSTNTRKIPNDSQHPVEHKQAGIRYLIKRTDHYCTQEDRRL